MAYTPHVLVQFGGSWTDATTEIWECTVRIGADGGGGVTIDPEGYLTDIKTPLATWFSASGTYMDPKAQLAFVKANHIGADGKYVDTTTTHLRDYSPAVVGGGTHAMPGFCTVAFTWETALLRGPGHRGRIYPPNATVVPVKAFQLSSDLRDAYAANGAGLLAVLKNTAGVNGRKGTPIVASKVNGAVTPIIGCSCDDVLDVQRRRKNRVKPTRSAIVAFA